MQDTQSQSTTPTNNTELTFGQKLVGFTFNPSGDDKVTRIKTLCAELADIIHIEGCSKNGTYLANFIHQKALGEISNASMNAVKYITFKE